METGFYLYLSLLLVSGFIISIPLKKNGLPVSIAYLLSGVFFSMFFRVPGEAVVFLKGMEELAIVLLFFDIGYELDIRNMRELTGFPLLLVLIQVLTTLLMVFGLGFFLGLSLSTVLVLGLASSFSSTVFTYKLMEDVGVSRREVRDLIYRVVIVQDIFIIIALGLLEASGMLNRSLVNVLLAITFPLVLFTLSYWFTHRFLKNYVSNDENGIALVIGYGLMLAYLSVLAGSSPAIGAFVAGLSFSGLHRELVESLRRINGFVLLLFFISLGIGISSYNLGYDVFLSVVILSLAIVIIHLFSTFTASVLMSGQSILYGLEAGLYLSTLSEFGLLIGFTGLQYGLVSGEVVLAVPLAIVLASALSSYLVARKARIIIWIYRKFPEMLRNVLNILTVSLRKRIYSRSYVAAVKALHRFSHLLGELVVLSVIATLLVEYIRYVTQSVFLEAVSAATIYVVLTYWAINRALKTSEKIIEAIAENRGKTMIRETRRFVEAVTTAIIILTSITTLILLNYEKLRQNIPPNQAFILAITILLTPITILATIYLLEKE